MPFQKGNKLAVGHSSPERIWAAAVRRAAMRAIDKKDKAIRIDRLAEKLIDEGLAGNTQALKEIGDRLDGKPAQVIEGSQDKPLRHRVEVHVIDPADRSPQKA